MLTRWTVPAFVVLAGFLLGWMTTPDVKGPMAPSTVEASSAVPPGADQRHCSTAHEEVAKEYDRYRQAVEAARLELHMQEAARVEYEGAVQRWTDDVDPRLQPDAFSAMVREVVDELGTYGALELDCEEFPCLVAVTVDDAPESGFSTLHLAPLTNALEERGLDGMNQTVSIAVTPRAHAIVALFPRGASDAFQKRMNFRAARFMDRRMEYLNALQEPSQ